MVSPGRNSITRPCDLHLLALVAGEVHLDAVALGIIEGMVTETRQIEISVEVPIDLRKQVEVEPGRNAAEASL